MVSNLTKKTTALIAVLLVFLIGLGGFGYYQFVYKHSPAYTMMLIGQAVKEHNVANFNRHVDVRSITKAYLQEEMNKDPEIAKDPFARMVITGLMDVGADTVAAVVDQMVAGDDEAVQNHKSANPLDRKVAEKSKENKNLKLESLETVTKNEDGTIEVKAVLANSETKDVKTVFMMLRPLDDGTWQVYKIKNLRALMDGEKLF